MSRNEDISNTIWTDPDFEALSAHATLLYLWSFTNLRCGMAGIYRVSERQMIESKVPLEAIPGALAELAEARFAFYEDSVLWIRTRVKHLRSRSPQMAKGIANDLRRVPVDHVLRCRFIEEYATDKWLRDALRETYTEGSGNLSENPIDKPDTHTLPGPSLEGPGLGVGQGQGSSSEKVELPEGFPDELRAHLRIVFKILRDLARRHNARAVPPLSLAAVVMARPHKPLVRAAYDYVAWADGQAQRRKDVVAGYRNWLDRTNDLAGFEELSEGLPASGMRPVRENADSLLRALNSDDWPANVTPLVVDAQVVDEGCVA